MNSAKLKKRNSSKIRRSYSIGTMLLITLLMASLASLVINVSYAPMFMPGPNGFLTPHYFGPYPNYATSQLPIVDSITGAITSGIKKFVDSLPGLGPAGMNNLGQYIPIAVPDNTTYPNCDYYEIAVVEYRQQMHSNLTATRLRGYVQLETPVVQGAHVALTYLNGTSILKGDGTSAIAVDIPRYLGPFIFAQKDRPVRIKFYNLLPTGVGGDLFIPVDTTVMGAGMGPLDMPGMPGMKESYTQNRATIHLHGGRSPWISDGTAHQWITPAGEMTSYPKGVSVYNVPDMSDPGPGAMTFYYSNAQSARLMFYHDHSYGITRLNVYAGEAAGYLLQDQIELGLIAAGIISAEQIPLIIQDKTFVPDNTTPITNMWGTFASQLAFQDPTWDTTKWGQPGDLWYPHVYMTMQNPYDPSGMNAFGRWQYGPYFWPPAVVPYGPVANPYYDPANPNNPMEPPMIPGTPNPSAPGEAFLDTPVINGIAYPYLEVEPKAYRFRILNAGDDRFWNLQLYVATTGIVSSITVTNGGSGYTSAPPVTISGGTGYGALATATINKTTGVVTAIDLITVGSGYTTIPTVTIGPPNVAGGIQATATANIYTDPTEVGMVPATICNQNLPVDWPKDGRQGGVPDPANIGPSFIQIGNEGGFLPAPYVIPMQPVDWNMDQGTFDFGLVNKYTLFLGTAERADVIVDFSQFAGKTLILYNDSPAPVPAADPRLDYYTCNPDQTDSGGAPSTLPGYGSNTRTIMQIRVADTVPAPPFDVTALNQAFASTATTKGAFVASQEYPIIVPQTDYNSAYNATFPDVWARIFDNSLTFTPIGSTTSLTIPFQAKAIQDEMGETFDDYGRMQAMLGIELPKTQALQQTTLLYNMGDPPTEIVKTSIEGTLIGSLGDGTQIWKITHNGVDTHTLHWHMYDVQLINRVAWDNNVRRTDPNELGWKETIRINPLQDTIVALRPIVPDVPFDLPNSIRPIDPTMPLGAVLKVEGQLGAFDTAGNPITIVNHLVNFGWEYMWHCHILAHEEMDMMRAIAVAVPPRAPSNLGATRTGNTVTLTWTDNSLSETGFTIQRAGDAAFTVKPVTFMVAPDVTTFTDTTVTDKDLERGLYYRVYATNTVGDTQVYPAPAIGFPTLTVNSAYSNVIGPPTGTTTLLSLTKTTGTNVLLTWSYTPSGDPATGFRIQRATNAGFTQNVATFDVPLVFSWTDTTTKIAGVRYYYRVAASNAQGLSTWSNTLNIRL